MSTSRFVLVAGATGNQGGAVARALLQRGHRVRALTRKPEGSAAVALSGLGATVVAGDFDEPESLNRAAEGVDAVFVMGTPFVAGDVFKKSERGRASSVWCWFSWG